MLLKTVVRELERPAVLVDRAQYVLGGTLRQFSMDLHHDLDLDAEQTTQVLRNLLDHGSGISYSTRRIKCDRAVEALRLWSCERSRKLCGLFRSCSTTIGHEPPLTDARSTGPIIGETARDR